MKLRVDKRVWERVARMWDKSNVYNVSVTDSGHSAADSAHVNASWRMSHVDPDSCEMADLVAFMQRLDILMHCDDPGAGELLMCCEVDLTNTVSDIAAHVDASMLVGCKTIYPGVFRKYNDEERSAEAMPKALAPVDPRGRRKGYLGPVYEEKDDAVSAGASVAAFIDATRRAATVVTETIPRAGKRFGASSETTADVLAAARASIGR